MPTAISWTGETWNPITGCSRISEECRNCYAEKISLKFGFSALPWTAANAAANITLHPERLDKLRTFKPKTMVFVNSMSDMFHELVPDEFIAEIFLRMNARPDLIFQCLTKRPERAAKWSGPWAPHIWMGTTCGHSRSLARIDALRDCGALVRFVSAEPLLDDLGAVNLAGIHWLIVGGESGPGFRPMDHVWARNLRDQCLRQGVAYFFKQDAAFRPETRPYLIHTDGSAWKWAQFPGDLKPPVRVEVQPRSKRR